jgi:LssY C-terminus
MYHSSSAFRPFYLGQFLFVHGLQRLAEAAPLRTSTPGKTPSDLTNLIFLGTEQQLIAAFGEAGWIAAEPMLLRARYASQTRPHATILTGMQEAPADQSTPKGEKCLVNVGTFFVADPGTCRVVLLPASASS